VVSGSRDEILKIWDLESSKCLHSIHAHNSPIWAVAIVVRKDGNVVVVSGAGDGTMRTWNGKTGKRLMTFKGHVDKVLSVFILNPVSDLPLILSAGCDKKIRVWELLSGKHVKMLEGHDEEITTITGGSYTGVASLIPISNTPDVDDPDNSTKSLSNFVSVIIVSGSRDLSIRVWDFKTGYLLFELLGHSACVYQVVLTRSMGKFSHIEDGSIIPEFALVPPNSPLIVSCGDDSTVKVWNLENGKLVKSFKWHHVSVRGVDASNLFSSSDDTSSDGSSVTTTYNPGIVMIASCGWDKMIHFHNLDELLSANDTLCDSCCIA
jgi:WD40 repeat protein